MQAEREPGVTRRAAQRGDRLRSRVQHREPALRDLRTDQVPPLTADRSDTTLPFPAIIRTDLPPLPTPRP